jgi:hypothetical protein
MPATCFRGSAPIYYAAKKPCSGNWNFGYYGSGELRGGDRL